MKRLGLTTAAVLVVVGLALSGGLAGATTRAAKEKPTATDIGVTSTEIRIGVIADVENPFRPGLFQGSVDAVYGVAKTIDQTPRRPARSTAGSRTT